MGVNRECIDTSCIKYTGSTNRILTINSVCKADEGEYQVYLSKKSNGPEYRSKNSILLHVLGGNICTRINPKVMSQMR